jgi:opacity protein-like surface antigen
MGILKHRSKNNTLLVIVLSAMSFGAALPAQVVPSAIWPGHTLWLEGNVSGYHAGFPYNSNQRILGVGVAADYHLNTRIDAEAEVHFMRYESFHGNKEDSYLLGPRYLLRNFGNLQPNAQCLIGMAKMQYPFQIGDQNYFVIAPGAGISYHMTRKWALHAEYEYQAWRGSPNIANEPSHRITPNGLSVGVAYRLLRVSGGRH